MRLIFSRDRAAQLDLLLASLERNADPEDTLVIWRASGEQFRKGYDLLIERRGISQFDFLEERAFERDARDAVRWPDDLVTFFCDDDVLFARAPKAEVGVQEISFARRLGANCRFCYPRGRWQAVPQLDEEWERWRIDWQAWDGDFAYPGSLDGSTFRRADLERMLEPATFDNPTELEDALQQGCEALAAELPLLAFAPRSSLCSIPANRVSEQSQVRHGEHEGESAEALNERWLAGGRLSFDAMDFSQVDGAHYELPLVWE